MIDQPFGDAAQMLRAPDLRLGDIRSVVLRRPLPFDQHVSQPDRGVFAFVLAGNLTLTIEGSVQTAIAAPPGTAFGFESGRPHRWTGEKAGDDGLVALLISSIPRRMGVLQRLPDGMIHVPQTADPFATCLRHAAEMHAFEIENPTPHAGEEVIRRCAEICLIQFVRYSRAQDDDKADIPAGLAHDEALLRAWSAYFAQPQRRWTLQALADAAGLGRTVFAERFRRVFGKPPLQTLTEMRLEQAEGMLRTTRAPLIEIAFTVGYNSEAAFVRAFHRQYGSPPGRFRAEQGLKTPIA